MIRSQSSMSCLSNISEELVFAEIIWSPQKHDKLKSETAKIFGVFRVRLFHFFLPLSISFIFQIPRKAKLWTHFVERSSIKMCISSIFLHFCKKQSKKIRISAERYLLFAFVYFRHRFLCWMYISPLIVDEWALMVSDNFWQSTLATRNKSGKGAK